MKGDGTKNLEINPDWVKLPLFDRSKWHRVRFGDVVENLNETCNPSEVGLDRFIGLEHLEPGSLRIGTWGSVADGTTFTRRTRPGHVLFGKRRAYQRKVAVAEFDAVVSGDIYVLGPKEKRLLPELLPFLCLSERFFQHAVGTSAGSLSPRTNWSSLASFEFDLPPLAQQRRIADICWAMDTSMGESISLLGAAGASISAIVSSLTDAKATAKWRSIRLVECAEIVSGQVDPKVEPYRSMTLVAPNHIEQGNAHVVGNESAEKQNAISGKYLFEPGDVVYSKIRPNLRKCFIARFRGLCSADMYALRPKQAIIRARYLLAIMLGDHFTSFAISRSVRTGIPKINRAELSEYVIPIPDVEVQELICEQLDQLDAVVLAIREQRARIGQMTSALLSSVI